MKEKLNLQIKRADSFRTIDIKAQPAKLLDFKDKESIALQSRYEKQSHC